MLKLLIFILFIFQSTTSHSKCGGAGIYSHPEPKTHIFPNQYIVLEAGNFHFLKELTWTSDGKTFPTDKELLRFDFVSDNHRVESQIIEKFKGSFNSYSFIVKPVSDLKVGQKYRLDMLTYEKYNKKFGTHFLGQDLSWTVVMPEKVNLKIPSFLEAPKFLKKETIEFGCGPSKLAYFSFRASAGDYIITEVADVKSGITNRAITIPKKQQIIIGRGMCSGKFEFKENHPYLVRFKLKNFHGKESDFTEFIPFDAPF